MEEAIQCPICYEIGPDAPKLMPYCGHHVCARCLDQWIAITRPYGAIRCPICKHKNKVKKCKKNSFCPPLTTNAKPRLVKTNQFQCSKTIQTLKDAFVGQANPEALWTCRICYKTLTQPRMLPFCQHSFCGPCLQTVYKVQTRCPFTGSIQCPTCRRKVIMRGKHAHDPPSPPINIPNILPVDYALNSILNCIIRAK